MTNMTELYKTVSNLELVIASLSKEVEVYKNEMHSNFNTVLLNTTKNLEDKIGELQEKIRLFKQKSSNLLAEWEEEIMKLEKSKDDIK
ncbi:MAG: hypothetical protein JJV93_00865 [Alphaproteobacteria bacterium]|nr:hypothetical protein [Alphaproteobacteria bacterium]